MHKNPDMLQIFHFPESMLFPSHKEYFHKIIQISVKNTLCIGSFMPGTKILDHLVWMQDITSDL